jgi:predicted transcriptional regulator
LISLKNWETIRIRCVRDKEPYKRVARDLGISKNTVRKYVQASTAPLLRASPGRTSLMSRFESHVDELLRDTPRITAGRVTQIIRAPSCTRKMQGPQSLVDLSADSGEFC